jgi:hypothetical protein
LSIRLLGASFVNQALFSTLLLSTNPALDKRCSQQTRLSTNAFINKRLSAQTLLSIDASFNKRFAHVSFIDPAFS